jgi:uncharacterized protein YndB with AHSA1/START domain
MTDHTPSEELVIEREFDAPRALVWRAFTDPDEYAQWFAPVGYSVPRESIDMDVRTGGHQRFTMVKDDDPSWSSPEDGSFSEVVEQELIVATEQWEGVPGMQDGGSMALRIEFHDAGPGRTRLVIRQGPFTSQMQDMAGKGWESSFTKLDALLAP